MSYDDARDSEQLRLNDVAIDEFIARYGTKAIAPAQRRTVFLFPGGMGSRLERASTPYDDRNPQQQFLFRTVWLTLETFLNNLARLLKMKKSPGDKFREADDHIIVALGAVELGCESPYAGFTEWCDDQDIDWFIFGWDWRRRLEDAAGFFLGKFVPHFLQRVEAQLPGVVGPLGKVFLVGHSSGGMLANSILRSADPFIAEVERVITVATPYYGYGGQLHRWTEGESLLNGPFDMHKDEIKEVIASLPGCYELHYADEQTFNDALPDLMRDQFFITQYPSRDVGAAAFNADPYKPQIRPQPPGHRYPSNTGFDLSELGHARDVVRKLASKLDPQIRHKLFNIRGVQKGVRETLGSIRWSWIPDDPEPITDEFLDAGDDTQPAWTARLASLPANQVITVEEHDINHMFIMNHQEVLAKLGTLIV